MINIHLNGDIVRCPDIAAIRKRIKERNEAENRCIHGIIEWKCEVWKAFVMNQPEIKKFSDCGPCVFAYNVSCPMHRKKVETGNMKKKFKIDNQVYRKIASAAHYLVKESNCKTLFITLTFPKFKKKVSYNEINNYFSKFVENLRTNYACGGYIAVREFGKKTHRVHFHLLLSIPFVPFPVLNAAWCHCIKDICDFSGRALLSNPKTVVIRNPARALRYICKYFAKTKGQVNKSRLVFMSNNIIQRPKQYTDTIEDILSGYKSVFIQQTSDYTTSFRITDSKEFNRFCEQFLYPFFELSYKKNEDLYSFPVNSS